MAFFDKNNPEKISSGFTYIPIRDPREKKISFEDLIPGISKAGDEFLKKYLVIVRTRLSRTLVEEWFSYLDGIKSEFVDAPEGEVDEDEFLGYMVQGFAMGACEDTFFEIQEPNLMAECVWGAMKAMSIQVRIESNGEQQTHCLSALLSGYYLSREWKKKNS